MALSNTDEWAKRLSFLMSKESAGKVELVGVGNPIKCDDSVGLYIVSKLRERYGARPSKFISIGQVSSFERSLSKAVKSSGTKSKMIIFDAIESISPPGSIKLANVADTKYGLFTTHNLPLKLISTLNGSTQNIFVLGVQPENLGIGEGLSKVVTVSADKIVSEVGELIERVESNLVNS